MTDMVEITIKLPDSMVARLQDYGVSDVVASIETFLRHIDEREIAQISRQSRWQESTNEEIESKIVALEAAAAKFRDGLTEAELAQIVHDMNVEYVDPKDRHLFDWLDDLPENER